MTTATDKITVRYWIGTTQHEGTATTYRGAMRIADRNQNAYGPTFWGADGNQLGDNSYGLEQMPECN